MWRPLPERTVSTPASPSSPATLAPEVREVAAAQRMLLLAIIASLVGNVLLRSSESLAIVWMISVAVLAFELFCVYRLARVLRVRNALVWMLAMFVPLVNLICLLVLNGRASRFLKENGVAVGLLGARL